MRALRGMRIAVLTMICSAIAGTTQAAPQVLSPWDVRRYVSAFEAVDRGDFIDAEMQSGDIKDRSLAGHLAFRQLMHPSAQSASYEDLAAWLEKYGDLPGAERVYTLALKRKPANAPPLKTPVLGGAEWRRVEVAAQGVAGRAPADRSRQAREAFYSGDIKRAFDLAPAAGDRWIAGLAAYRLKNFALAESYLGQVARDEGEDPWIRSGAAFWAARALEETGDTTRAQGFIKLAARHPTTFYGMIAERRMRLQAISDTHNAPTGQFVPASFSASSAPSAHLNQFIRDDARAHRATGLAQVGMPVEAGLELRAGLALAKTETERSQWMGLILALNAPLTSDADVATSLPRGRSFVEPDYPTPVLEPKWGFTIDRALVYAIVRQESRFNPAVVSPSGAVGLMQLMPEAAARAAGDDKLKADMSPLFDPAFNLRVGQDYVTWLMERGVGYDILRTVAAYNGGPGTLLKTAQKVGEDDSLLIIESLPSLETRNYVEKVMAGYWTYRKKFGMDSKTLDALAMGANFVDARLDR
ncbi:lytic transglycosylase domain-containing protein [Phenylobacterium sp.]|uniref:lytic transglycosylase domain-containing protein n=2 Tax=Phenylobacterium sp. TaxID=1871053 RepID=UPI002730BB34|nr:lytic transglycosylase domain-containing protein [Phenylobacterium sp.]MDP1600674.1 lytic transglycosylase domain-containing protein [Phenylobacterium sp.]